MSIALVMIVKDDADTIQQTLESAAPVCDRYVIVDTGSTDGTIEIARGWLETHPGDLQHRRWHGFAYNRTEALELGRASGADYLLMLDADHTLAITGTLPELTADEYQVSVRSGSLAWALPLLLRAERLWTYRGVAHAYLCCDDGQPVAIATVDGMSIAGGGGASTEKLERDRKALEAEHRRTVFYLARTYEDLGRPLEAIPLYRERAEMGGYPDEAFYARYKLGVLLGENVSFNDAAAELLAAWNMNRARVEPLRALSRLAGSVADKSPVPEGLFVHADQYRSVV